MPRPRPFVQVDVFSEQPYRGNPVAVILDSEGLSDQDMQAVARWTNLSETTFLLPATDPGADYRLRIFTPTVELAFAGHPTLGSAHAWLEAGGAPRDPEVIVQQVPAGLIQVRRGEGLLSFAAPPTLRTGAIEAEYLSQIVDALGIAPDQVHSHQWVDNGPGWAVVRLGSAQQVLDLEPDFSRLPSAMVGAIGAYPHGSEYAYEMRTFAPLARVAEDPVCGSMNASVGQWLIGTGEVEAPYRVSQGLKLGRAGEVTISTDEAGQVWVGGATATLFRGVATV